jgi:signal transduction histidine kinase
MHAALHKLANPQRLASRLGFILVAAGFITFAAILALSAFIISDRFGALEAREIASSQARLEAALQAERSEIKSKTLDYSIWTDAYNFIEDGNAIFAADNLTFDTLSTLGIIGMLYHRIDGVSVNSLSIDMKTGKSDTALNARLKKLTGSPQIIAQIKKNQDFQFFANIDGRLMLVSVGQTHYSIPKGRPNGYIVFVSQLQESKLEKALQLPIIFDLDNPKNRTEIITSSDRLNVRLPAPGIDGKSAGTIHFNMPRDVIKQGWSLVLMLSLGIAVMLILLLLILNFALRRAVILPLARIRQHFAQVGSSGKLEALPISPRRDEIGAVEAGLNEMIEQLTSLRNLHEMQSYELGKAQSAIGVLHNVGNGLSPLKVVLSRLFEELLPTAKPEIARALAELGSEELQPDRRKKLIAFSRAAIEQAHQQLDMGRDQVRDAGRHLAHALDSIEQAKGSSRIEAEVESCNVGQLLHLCIQAARAAVHTPFDCDVIPFEQSYAMANRVLLSQVVTNLLVNAAEAIAAHGREDGRITITQARVETELGPMHQLTIVDNGDGFDPETEKKLFGRGYSTRAGKKGGTGLHWCYNIINAMAGTLTLTSDGRGKGARAVITLPVLSPIGNEESRRTMTASAPRPADQTGIIRLATAS